MPKAHAIPRNPLSNSIEIYIVVVIRQFFREQSFVVEGPFMLRRLLILQLFFLELGHLIFHLGFGNGFYLIVIDRQVLDLQLLVLLEPFLPSQSLILLSGIGLVLLF